MKNYVQHIGHELPQEWIDYNNTQTTDELFNQAKRLKFDSWCPILLENDSPELCKHLQEASELLIKYADYTNPQYDTK